MEYKNIAISVLTIVAGLLFGAVTQYIVGAYSDDIFAILMEPLVLSHSIAIVFCTVLFLKLVAGVKFFKQFSLGVLGIIIMLYFYPPYDRFQEVDDEIIGKVTQFFETETTLEVESINISRRRKISYDPFQPNQWYASVKIVDQEKIEYYSFVEPLRGDLYEGRHPSSVW